MTIQKNQTTNLRKFIMMTKENAKMTPAPALVVNIIKKSTLSLSLKIILKQTPLRVWMNKIKPP